MTLDAGNDRAGRPARPTIADVARAAGVSPTTVSHVLSGNRPVAESTAERVRAVIRASGFKPSHVARSLRMSRSLSVGLLIPDITNPYYPVLARGLQDRLQPDGYQVLISSTDGHRETMSRLVEGLLDRQVDAVVIEARDLDPVWIRELVPQPVRLVLLGREPADPATDAILIDDERGIYEATTLLAGLGHERVAFVGAGGTREAGFRRARETHGLDPDPALVREAELTRPAGAAVVARLLSLPAAPTAVVCGNDLIAVGALDAAREGGRRVPGGLSVTGFDDIEVAALVTPALTTVRNPAYEIGRAAAELILEAPADDARPGRRLVLPCPLTVRQSTAAPPGAV
jgi:LacI family transcriptional regulator